MEQNLPLDPAGVVYNSVTRLPVAGAVVAMLGSGADPATHLVGGSLAATQTTGSDGFYQFLLQNAFPSGVYTLSVTSPEDYLPAPSGLLPPAWRPSMWAWPRARRSSRLAILRLVSQLAYP